MKTFFSVLAASSLFIAASAQETNTPLALVQTIPLPGVEGRMDHFALDVARQRLFLAALDNNTVEVLDLAAGRVLRSLGGFEEPQGIGLAPDLDRVTIANRKDGSIRVYDAGSLEPVTQFDFKGNADNVRYDPAAHLFWIGRSEGSGSMVAIDGRSGKVVAEVPLAAHPESFQLEASGLRLFVNVPDAGHLAVLNRESKTVIATWPITNAAAFFPMALDEANHRLFLGCRKPARLLVLDSDTGATVATLPIVGDTDDLFYDAALRRIFVAGGGGQITIIGQTDSNHYDLLGSVQTAPGARTAYYASQTRRLYLAVPQRGAQRAEVRVYAVESAPLRRNKTILLPQMKGGLNHMAIDPRRQRLFAAAPADKSLEVVDLVTGKPLRSLAGGAAAERFAPEFDQLYVARGRTVVLFDGGSLNVTATGEMPSAIDEGARIIVLRANNPP